MSEHVNGGALNDEQRDALKTEHWRWCVAAPPGREKYIGTRFQKVGDRPGTSRWHAEDHSTEVMVDSPGDWVFSNEAPGVFDKVGLPFGSDTYFWGEDVRVKRCPKVAGIEGLTGTLLAPPPESDHAARLRIGNTTYYVTRGHDWEFVRAVDAELTAAELEAGVDIRVPLRRSREVYDHGAFVRDLDAAVKEIRDLLVEKNRAYGNSALDPVRIFSKADPMEQLFVRIDDKLSRLKRGHAAGEDVVKDLQGYLLLVRVAQMRAERSRP